MVRYFSEEAIYNIRKDIISSINPKGIIIDLLNSAFLQTESRFKPDGRMILATGVVDFEWFADRFRKSAIYEYEDYPIVSFGKSIRFSTFISPGNPMAFKVSNAPRNSFIFQIDQMLLMWIGLSAMIMNNGIYTWGIKQLKFRIEVEEEERSRKARK